ncbi:MAG: hypothetical protein GY721_13075, partial [Deltaproteobacteria bacterium]|nr:hypothetical protein [Deltaproteobacteria bacterium]
PDSVIRILEDSDYGVDMAESLARHSRSQAVEEAISRNLVRSYRKMLSFATGPARDLLDTLLGKWDIYNIKTILRGIHSGSGPNRILENIVPAGRLEGASLEELANQPEVKALADMLATWNIDYFQPISGNLKRYIRERDLARLEYELDSFYFQTSLGRLKKRDSNRQQIQSVIETEIDIINVMTTLRLVSQGLGIEKGGTLFLTHGALDLKFLLDLLKCESPIDILERLERTRYAYAVEKSILLVGETGDISIIERFLEEILIRKCVKMFYRGDPLGISIAIGYIWLKYNEFINIRLIARGLAFGMPVNAIRQELVFV